MSLRNVLWVRGGLRGGLFLMLAAVQAPPSTAAGAGELHNWLTLEGTLVARGSRAGGRLGGGGAFLFGTIRLLCGGGLS